MKISQGHSCCPCAFQFHTGLQVKYKNLYKLCAVSLGKNINSVDWTEWGKHLSEDRSYQILPRGAHSLRHVGRAGRFFTGIGEPSGCELFPLKSSCGFGRGQRAQPAASEPLDPEGWVGPSLLLCRGRFFFLLG